jgi:hypothetical protein
VSFVGNNSIDPFASTLNLAERTEAQVMSMVVPASTVLLCCPMKGSYHQLAVALFFSLPVSCCILFT